MRREVGGVKREGDWVRGLLSWEGWWGEEGGGWVSGLDFELGRLVG